MTDPRRHVVRALPRRPTRSSTTSRRPGFSFALPGREEAADAGPARRRRARARRARLRLPQPRREPRAGLPLAARAQPAGCTPSRSPSTGSATSTSTRGCRCRCVTADELDRLLGSVLTYADESFNTILELGFASSIRKEWEWRKLARRVDREPRGVPRLARGRRGPDRPSGQRRATSTKASSAGTACTTGSAG